MSRIDHTLRFRFTDLVVSSTETDSRQTTG
jgi:hypothetical protein